MKNKKLVSVIIPCFNSEKTIYRTLLSVYLQTYNHIEVIVVDDGSTDRTHNLIDEFKGKFNLNYIYINNSGGPAKPRNLGIYKSSGEFIALLDSDDWWLPNKLEICMNTIEMGYDVVCHNMNIWSNNKFFFKKILKTNDFEYPVKDQLLNKGNNIINSSIVFRKILIQNNKNIFVEDRRLVASEDYDAWIKISEVTDKFFHIDSELGFYSIQEGSITTDLNNYINNHYLINKYKSYLIKHYGKIPNQFIAKQIRKTIKLGYFIECFFWILLFLKISKKIPKSQNNFIK